MDEQLNPNEPDVPEQPVDEGAQDLTEQSSDASAPSANLDLLLDVQLEATIRFGECQLLLRDVLCMAPGSLIELDRQLNEPADLLVAGRLLARGEVVVVNGNFGLRITELTSAANRTQLIPA